MVSPVGFWFMGAALLTAAMPPSAGRSTGPPAGPATLAVRALQACAAGTVGEGGRLLDEYLRATKDATAIFNMARCYQLNGMVDQALARFHQYLGAAGDLPADERRQVDDHIRDLEAQQRAKAGTPSA